MYEDVTNYIVASIESVIAFITDVYCNIEYRYTPLMPYILSSLNHASYLPSVSQQILPLYNIFMSFFDDRDKGSFMNIDCNTIQGLTEKIKYLLDCSDLRLSNIDTRYCATRLIWDEHLSDILKCWLGYRPDDKMKAVVSNYVRDLVCNLDPTCNDGSIDKFVEKLSVDKNKDSIVFSIISRHTIIREFQHFIELASYRLYVDTEQEIQGINWLAVYCMAEKIVNKCLNFDSHKLNFTPAMFLEYEIYEKELKKVVEETLLEWKIIENYTPNQKLKIVTKCLGDDMLTSNLRRIADLLLSFGQEEERRQNA